jgi:diguanylate cyclase (GGDEF)-like protein
MRDVPPRPERRHRGPDKPIQALLLIDIDLFKQTNDRYGHAPATRCSSRSPAGCARRCGKRHDRALGGEEFLVFVPATSADKLDEIAARIMTAIAMEPIEYKGNSIRVTASIGYAPMPCRPRMSSCHGSAPSASSTWRSTWRSSRPQLRVRHPPAAPQRRRGDGPDRAQPRIGVGESAWSRCTSSPAGDRRSAAAQRRVASPPASALHRTPVSDLAAARA